MRTFGQPLTAVTPFYPPGVTPFHPLGVLVWPVALHPPGYPGAGGGGGCWWVGLGRDAARDVGVAGRHCGGVEGPRVRVGVRVRVSVSVRIRV